jgi:NADH dehydrogenase
VRVLMAEVTGFDLDRREVEVKPSVAGGSWQRIPYDTLVVAGGSSYAYFGHDDWRSLALEVKTLDSALEVRGRILQAFEAAELETDPEARAKWLTFVVIGAGPTGVEMAGQIAELANDTLPAEFRQSDPRSGRVLLVEMADRVLPGFAPSLSHRAARSLERLGVTVLVDHTVVDVQPGRVEVKAGDGSVANHATGTVVWAAGVTASPLARTLGEAAGAEVDRAGRVSVEPDLTIPGHPEVLAIGDMVRVRDAGTGEARVLPGLAPVAMQEGRYAGRLVKDRLEGRPTPPFHYRDKGMLATIGRERAVADISGIRLSGFVAWITWLAVHLFYLIGFENRMIVVLRWAYSFFTRGRGTRLITDAAVNPPPRSGP